MKKYLLIAVLTMVTLLHAVFMHEGFETGRLYTNSWTCEPVCENWKIMDVYGFHLRFTGLPEINDFNSSLVSRSFDITSCTALYLDYKTLGSAMNADTTLHMAVEISTDGSNWLTLQQHNTGVHNINMPLQEFSHNLVDYISSGTIKFRLRVYGNNSSNLMFWRFDDIVLRDQNYQTPALLTGEIWDFDMHPVTGALISDGDCYTRSDINGNYSLPVQPDSLVNLSIQAFGYDDSTSYVTNLVSGESYMHNFYLVPEQPLMEPYRLTANVYNTMDGPLANISWDRVYENSGDSALQLFHDSPPADEFYYPFMVNEYEYLVTRYVNDWELSIGAIKLAMKSMESSQVEIVGFYETDGHPDLNQPLFSEPKIFEFIPDVPGYPQWVQFPLWLTIQPQTPFYIGVKYVMDSMFSIGVTDVSTSHTVYKSDGDTFWQNLPWQDAMIRVLGQEFEPWDDRSFIGYNLYKDHQLLNSTPTTFTFYEDVNPAWGEHLYYVIAVYSEGESNISNAARVMVSPLNLPYISFQSDDNGDDYVSILIQAYHINGGLSQINLKRNGVIIHSINDIPATPILYSTNYLDSLVCNDEEVGYQLIASYQDGSIWESEVHYYRLLLPPQNVTLIGCVAGVEINWEAPSLDDRVLLGYKIERYYGEETVVVANLINQVQFIDTGVIFGEIYSYGVAAVYEDGLTWTPVYEVVAGPPVLHQVTALAAEVENGMVQLTWDRPDDGKKIFGKDSQGTSVPFTFQDSYKASVKFSPGELISCINMDIISVAFVPASDLPYNLKVYQCYPDDEFQLYEHLLSDPVPGQWNEIEIWGFAINSPTDSYRFEIETTGGLMLDDADTPTAGANQIIINDVLSDLATGFSINHNWKMRLKLGESQNQPPVIRGLYPELETYKVFRNGEMVSQLSEYDQYFSEPISATDVYTYYLLAVYDMGNSEPSDSVVVQVSGAEDDLGINYTYLQQNYPNPFNPETTIRFSLKSGSHANLSVYNLKGQLVRTLVNEKLSAGQHALVWRGTDNRNKPVSGGVYLLRLKTDSGNFTRKMIILK
ncbi:MAG: T9SS type A sorting domain-containing protein [Candidatus Cloacimonadaceae bacterium]